MTSILSDVSVPDTEPATTDAESPVLGFTSGRLLAGNTLWNLAGSCFPILVAVVCLPLLKRGLGTDRLGMMSLAWTVIGYFSLFDLGLSRALTKLVAEKLGQKRLNEIPSLICTSLYLMTGLGLIGAAVILVCSSWFLQHLLKSPPELYREALVSFYWLGVSIPIVVATAGLRGVLEALQQFRLATAIRIPMGIFTYLGPVLILPFSHNLVPIVAALVLGRVVACLAHLWACFRVVPGLRQGWQFHASSIGPLFRMGSWMTVSNIVGPLMVTFDRFVIGSMISVSAVAYYSVPFDTVTKLWLVPAALAGVLFPAFSTTAGADRGRLVFLFDCALKYSFMGLFPVVAIVVAFSPEALRMWLGADFGFYGAPVARVLAAAVFLNCLAFIPFTQLQGCGRPDITAKLHFFELPIYVPALFLLARGMGIRGVALAWLLRVALDSVLLFVFSWRQMRDDRFVVTKLPLLVAVSLAFFAGITFVHGVEARLILVCVTCVVVLLATWFWILSPRERGPLRFWLRGNPAA